MAAHAGRRIDPELLLSNASWVRALALRLVHDEAGADDVMQDTLAAAVARPPASSVPLAPWLARVARNFSLRLLRSGTRRRERETRRLLAEPTPSVEESAARTEMFHEVVGAVLALEPLYRDVVVQRYFEALDVAQVAVRLGIPRETAHTRLRRALALLRTRLDAKYGARSAWTVALLPVGQVTFAAGTASSVAATSGAGATTTTATTLGGTLMAASTKAVVGASLGGAVLGGALIFATGLGLEHGSPSERADAGRAESQLEAAGRPDAASDPSATGTSPKLEGIKAGPPSLAAALGPVSLELPPAVSGTITGRVTSKSGAPLQGVVVRAWSWHSGNFKYLNARVPVLPSVEERLREALRQARWEEATRRETLTDAEGTYVFRDLLDVSYHIGAWADGLILRTRGSENSVRAGGTIDFVGDPVVVLPVSVLLPDGSIPDQATVSYSHPKLGGGGGNWWSRSQPFIEIELGDWSLTAEIRPEFRSQPVAVSVGDTPSGVTLHLQQRNCLRGVLRFDPADVGWIYATVTATRQGAGAPEEPQETGARPPDWAFAFEDLEAGEYELTTTLANSVPLARMVVDVQGLIRNQVLPIPRLTPAQVLEARIVGPDGAALSADDVSFSLMERSSNRISGTGARASQRADGIFLIPLESASARERLMQRELARRGRAGAGGTAGAGAAGGPGGGSGAEGPPDTPPSPPVGVEHFLQVRSQLHGSKDVPYVPGTTTRVEITLP